MHKRTLSVPASVVAVLALGAPAFGFVVNEGDVVVEGHRQRQAALMESSQAIMARAESENGRDLTAAEQTEIEGLTNEFEDLERQITLRERVNAQNARLLEPRGRQVDPDPIDGDDAPRNNVVERPINTVPQREQGASGRRPAEPRTTARGNAGFRHMGDFANSVRMASVRQGGELDPRLRNAAASTFASEGTGADGGFLVPPDFRNEIIARVFGDDSLITRTRRMQSASNTIVIPVDTTTPWGGTGVQSFWTAEGGVKQQSKPVFENATIKAHTLATLVPVTEELLEDAPALDGYLRMAVPREMDFKISNAVVRGGGAGQPLGILNSGALVTVAAESGQSADTIVAANVLKMFSRLPSGSMNSAVWIAHPDTLPQLATMQIGNQPAFMPAGGLSQAPFATLLGRPLIFHQVAETVGDIGDLMLVDFNEYVSLTKTGGGRDANGIRSDVSIHLWFDQDLVAYRFTIRIGGQPLWNTAIAQRDGGNTQSPYVVLAAR